MNDRAQDTAYQKSDPYKLPVEHHTGNCHQLHITAADCGTLGYNKQQIQENNARDDAQQHQLDANDALDATQQTQINSNTEAIQQNESRDDSQQLQINETIELLNQNISDDERQQAEINANTTEIIRLQGEMPKLSIEGTTMIIGQRKDD